MQKCTTQDIVQFTSCWIAGTQLPDCPKILSNWNNVGPCIPSKSHGRCGPGQQTQRRACRNGSGNEICAKNDMVQFISCREAGSKLPDCPKVFGEWKNVGACAAIGDKKGCGPGTQDQIRTCSNGTGIEVCSKDDTVQRIACRMAGTGMPDCPRKFGPWKNVGNCIGIGDDVRCGLGRQEQRRSCEDGTGPEICTERDKLQIISCKEAGTDLPDCPKRFGAWKNVGNCIPIIANLKCGPGTQLQTRTCQNGTGTEFCTKIDTEQTVSCDLAGTRLQDCPKHYGDWRNVGPCVTKGIEPDCGPGFQIQQRSCKNGTGSQVCNDEDEMDNKIMKKLDVALEKTHTLVQLAFTGLLKYGSFDNKKVKEYENQLTYVPESTSNLQWKNKSKLF